MKSYIQILKTIKEMNWNERINSQISLAVYCAADGEDYSNEEFKGLCQIVKTIEGKMDEPLLQLVADAVCDAYFRRGYGYAEHIGEISAKDFEQLSAAKEETVINAVWYRLGLGRGLN